MPSQLAAGTVQIASCFFIAKPTKIDALLSWASSRSLGFCYSHRFPGLQRLRVSSCPSQGIQLTAKRNTPTTKSPTPNAVPVAEPIPLSDVAKRLESSRRQIREVGERVQPPEVADIAKEIEATRKTFAEEAKSARLRDRQVATAGGTFRPRSSWKNRAARLAKWQQVISRWTQRALPGFHSR